ncbi:MAG: hypothetical protein WC807_21100 [Hyphomicrobium sp.]|jgi:hypothetical protein
MNESITSPASSVQKKAMKTPIAVASPGIARGSPLCETPQSTHTKNPTTAI